MSRPPGVPLDTVWDQLSAADRDRPGGQLGETIAALHQLPPPVIRGLVACGLTSFRGRAARAVGQRTARPELASAMGGSDSTVPRWGRVAVPAAGAAAHRGHAPAPADRPRP